MALSIGVDVGGTKIAAGVVDDDGRVSGVIPRVTLLAAISEQAVEASETNESEGADA